MEIFLAIIGILLLIIGIFTFFALIYLIKVCNQILEMKSELPELVKVANTTFREGHASRERH